MSLILNLFPDLPITIIVSPSTTLCTFAVKSVCAGLILKEKIMANVTVKKIIFFISTLLLSNFLYAQNLQYFINQFGTQPLSSNYEKIEYVPSAMMDKAIEGLPFYKNIKKCSTDNVTDAIIVINPILSYQTQSTILYGDLYVNIYQTRSSDETSPDNFIEKMKISYWITRQFDQATMHKNIDKVYTELLKKLAKKLDSLKVDKNYPTDGSYCNLLDKLRDPNINLIKIHR